MAMVASCNNYTALRTGATVQDSIAFEPTTQTPSPISDNFRLCRIPVVFVFDTSVRLRHGFFNFRGMAGASLLLPDIGPSRSFPFGRCLPYSLAMASVLQMNDISTTWPHKTMAFFSPFPPFSYKVRFLKILTATPGCTLSVNPSPLALAYRRLQLWESNPTYGSFSCLETNHLTAALQAGRTFQ